jgi:hypothetical protein
VINHLTNTIKTQFQYGNGNVHSSRLCELESGDIHPASQQENYYAISALINDNPNALKLTLDSAGY